MGCWNETCMVSHLPIYEGDPIDFVLLACRNPRLDCCHPDGVFVPVCPPVRGRYDDYGNMENVRCDGVAAKLLRSCGFFVRKEETARHVADYVPLVPDYDVGPYDPAIDDETFVRGLIRAVQAEDVYLEDHDPLHGRVMLQVHVAFLHARFRDMALEAMQNMEFRLEPQLDVAYRARQVGAMRGYLRYAYLPEIRPEDGLAADAAGIGEIKDLIRLQCWLDRMRVAWAPSTGTGSQEITDTGIVAFHKAIYDMAEEQARIWED